MNVEEFRQFAHAGLDYLVDYFENIREKTVLSTVQPGFLREILPSEIPDNGETWQDVLKDVDKYVMPALTHWHSPSFHAYMPTANSYPGIVGELILSGLGTVASDWESSPACTELEMKMMDWLVKMMDLPRHFLNSSNNGGGLIQNAASEATLVALLAARKRTIQSTLFTSNLTEAEIGRNLVAYTSEQSNSSVEKAGLLGSVLIRLLPTDENESLRGDTLMAAIARDRRKGLVPCCVIATLGTTGTCAFDNLEEISSVCQSENVWLHVDAAYAGAAFVCPEYRYLMKGIEKVDSYNFNPHKWMLVNSDCSAMWFKNTEYVEKAFNPKEYPTSASNIPNVQNWQIPNTRRFRSLKLWFVIRIYGVEGIQKHIRHQIFLAKYFGKLVSNDSRFEVCTSNLGVVSFRLKGHNSATQTLLDKIGRRKQIFVMPYYLKTKLVIRLVICSRFTEKLDVQNSWKEIFSQVDTL